MCKDFKTSNILKCHNCQEVVHFSCAPKAISDNSKEKSKANGDYKCPGCIVYPLQRKASNNNIDQLEELKKQVTLPTITYVKPVETTNAANLSNTIDMEKEDQLTCDECMFKFLDTASLSKHMEDSHSDIRGNKRSRHETSLIFDPAICNVCDQLKGENSKLKEQLNISQMVYNDTKNNLENSNKTIDNLSAKNEELKTQVSELRVDLSKYEEVLAKTKEDAERTKSQTKELEGELSKEKDKFKGIAIELAKAKEDLNSARRSHPPQSSNGSQSFDEEIQKKDEELEMLKEKIREKDKCLKKLDESHNLEVNKLKKDKKKSDDSLNCATLENTKLKDKESTLIDVFKSMKEYMNAKLKNIQSPEEMPSPEQPTFSPPDASSRNEKDTTPPMVNCDECSYKAETIESLNRHKRNKHIRTVFPCLLCNFHASSLTDLKEHQKSH